MGALIGISAGLLVFGFVILAVPAARVEPFKVGVPASLTLYAAILLGALQIHLFS